MFNLILKDILIQKRILLFGIIYILILIFSFQEIGSPMFLTSVIGLSYMMVQSACAYDEKNKSDILLNSLPISRNTIVIARYVSVFVFSAISIVVYALISVIINMLQLTVKAYPVTLEGIIGILFAIAFVCGIYLPIYFKVGYIKSKIINFVMIFGFITVFGAVLPGLLENKDQVFVQKIIQFFDSRSDIQIAAVILALTILLHFISYMISLNFYRKREF